MVTPINAILNAQKYAVAEIVKEYMGDNGFPVAEILERELGEQACFDHRDMNRAQVLATWCGLPSIGELIKTGHVDNTGSLSHSSYAFRLTVVARLFIELPKADRKEFIDLIEQLGLGCGEVIDYAHDFLGFKD